MDPRSTGNLPVDLHALANQPGAGRAFGILDQLGAIGEDPSAPRWEVTVRGEQIAEAVISVRASSREQAVAAAERKARIEGFDWLAVGDVDVDWSSPSAIKLNGGGV